MTFFRRIFKNHPHTKLLTNCEAAERSLQLAKMSLDPQRIDQAQADFSSAAYALSRYERAAMHN